MAVSVKMCVCTYMQSSHSLPCATVHDICSSIPCQDYSPLVTQRDTSHCIQHTVCMYIDLSAELGTENSYKHYTLLSAAYRARVDWLRQYLCIYIFFIPCKIFKFLSNSFLCSGVLGRAHLMPVSIPMHRPHTLMQHFTLSAWVLRPA